MWRLYWITYDTKYYIWKVRLGKMNLKEWRRLAMQSVTLFLVVVICSVCFSDQFQMKSEDTVLADNIQQEDSGRKKDISSQKDTVTEQTTDMQGKEYSEVQENQSDKRVVVIDAGHGGMDEGTSSPDGKCLEKDYTLLVTKRMKDILEAQNIQVYCTRTTDKMVSKKARIQMVKKVNPDLFISVHCNASTVGDRVSRGIETLYSNRRIKGANLTNKRLAQILLSNLGKTTNLEERGVIRRENLYLLHHSKVPAAIVEIGYITNIKDMKYIMKKKGQQEIAQGICEGIIQALEEIE